MTEHAHEWDGDETRWYCTQCAETTTTCGTCWGPVTGPRGAASSLLLCEGCLNRERGKLRDIMEAAEEIIHEPRSVVPAYAADLARARSTDPERLPFGLDATTDDPDSGVAGIRTAAGVESELQAWATLWADAGADTENLTAHTYLASRLLWAAHNPGISHWDRYRAAMGELLHHTRSLLPPEVEQAGPTCFDCGGKLVRQWRDDGLGDDVFCGTCRRAYDDSRYRLAFRAKVESEADPNTLVTEREAREIFPSLGANTIHVWMQRGLLTSPGWRKGRRLFRLGDIRGRLADAGTA